METLKRFMGKGPNQLLVEEATSDVLPSPDWEKNLAVCDVVNNKLDTAREVLRAVRRRTSNPSPHVQFLALVLLEAMIKNGGHRLYIELAQYNDLRDDLVKISRSSGSLEALTARDHAMKILMSLRVFSKAPEKMRPLAQWYVVAVNAGTPFAAYGNQETEDWTELIGLGVGVAHDPRNYHEEARLPAAPPAAAQHSQLQQQQQYARYGTAVPQQQQPPPQQQQPMIVTGPDGRPCLLQPLPQGAQVAGAVRAPPAVQQHISSQYSAYPAQGRPQYQHQRHHHHHHHHHHQQQQHQQHQQHQHMDPHAHRQASPEEQEKKLTEELHGVLDQVALMKDMLDAAEAEGSPAAAIRDDEVISQIASQLRSAQSRVSYVISIGGGSSSLELLLQYNDSLVECLERYAGLSGGIGIPADAPPPADPSLVRDQQALFDRHQASSRAPPYQQQQQQQQQQQYQPQQQHPPAVAASPEGLSRGDVVTAQQDQWDEFSKLRVAERSSNSGGTTEPSYEPDVLPPPVADHPGEHSLSIDELFAMPSNPAEAVELRPITDATEEAYEPAYEPAVQPSAPAEEEAAPVATHSEAPAAASYEYSDPAPAAAAAAAAPVAAAVGSPEPVSQPPADPEPAAVAPAAAPAAEEAEPKNEDLSSADVDFEAFLNDRLPAQ